MADHRKIYRKKWPNLPGDGGIDGDGFYGEDGTNDEALPMMMESTGGGISVGCGAEMVILEIVR